MTDYLMPQSNISIQDQREIFSIRCRTNKLGANREILEFCETKCGEILDNSHIFKCVKLNEDRKTKFDFEKILNGYIFEKKTTFRSLETKPGKKGRNPQDPV